MSKPGRGLHETLVTEALARDLERLEAGWVARRRGLRKEEAADRLAWHLARVTQRVLAGLDEKERVALGLGAIRRLVALLAELPGSAEFLDEALVEDRPVLHGIAGHLPDGNVDDIVEPMIPLLDTTLLTNSPGEPRVGSQIIAEIPSADRIDCVMAFIRKSGIAPLMEGLRRHRGLGRPLRVLTTTYTGTTEAAALDALQEAGADVRVSYDTSGTRLHAKAWLFHRESGFSTAYLGSSNLTHSAQFTGLEWNVRVSGGWKKEEREP